MPEETNPDIAILGIFKDHVEEVEAALDTLDGGSSTDKEKALASLRKAVQFFSSCVPYVGALISDVAFFESLQEKEETGICTDGACQNENGRV